MTTVKLFLDLHDCNCTIQDTAKNRLLIRQLAKPCSVDPILDFNTLKVNFSGFEKLVKQAQQVIYSQDIDKCVVVMAVPFFAKSMMTNQLIAYTKLFLGMELLEIQIVDYEHVLLERYGYTDLIDEDTDNLSMCNTFYYEYDFSGFVFCGSIKLAYAEHNGSIYLTDKPQHVFSYGCSPLHALTLGSKNVTLLWEQTQQAPICKPKLISETATPLFHLIAKDTKPAERAGVRQSVCSPEQDGLSLSSTELAKSLTRNTQIKTPELIDRELIIQGIPDCFATLMLAYNRAASSRTLKNLPEKAGLPQFINILANDGFDYEDLVTLFNFFKDASIVKLGLLERGHLVLAIASICETEHLNQLPVLLDTILMEFWLSTTESTLNHELRSTALMADVNAMLNWTS